MHLAFSDPLYGGKLQYPEVSKSDEANKYVKIQVLNKNYLYNLDETLKLGKLSVNGEIARNTYRIRGDKYTAYAFFTPISGTGKAPCAALIVPPHGLNEASFIQRRKNSLYPNTQENILNVVSSMCDSSVVMKPNNDYISIHSKGKKLRHVYFSRIAHKLYPESTRGAYYIANVAVFVKSFKRKYEKVFLLGLSEGTKVAQVAAVLSEPDIAVLASGFSAAKGKAIVDGEAIYTIGFENNVYFLPDFPNMLQSTPTKFVYAFGRREEGIEGGEAVTGFTCKKFSKYGKVRCILHDGGHGFPAREISRLIAEEFGR